MTRSITILYLILTLASPAAAIDYWPAAQSALTYEFQEVGGPGSLAWNLMVWYDGEQLNHLVEWRLGHVHGDLEFVGGQWLEVTASDVVIAQVLDYWPLSAQLSPMVRAFAPPLDIVRAGMQAGSSWTWSGTLGFSQQLHCVLSVAAETVTVPFGTFETLRVDLVYQASEPLYLFAPLLTSLWLDRYLGPIKLITDHFYWLPAPGQQYEFTWELVDLQGEIVATQARTWTQIRSLFVR